jgi:hypothetical protein
MYVVGIPVVILLLLLVWFVYAMNRTDQEKRGGSAE